MVLSKLLAGVPVRKLFQTMYGKMVLTHEVDVRGVQYDSRKVGRDEMFVAIRGEATDGHLFITDAVRNGARAVVMDNDEALADSFFMHAGVVKIVVEDARKALAVISANFYDRPGSKLIMVGVTGTNGKTTTTHLLKSVLESAGGRVGLVGTIGYVIGDEQIPATHTTPESMDLQRMLAQMVARGCTAAVLEVSSHSLAMHRVYGIDFRLAVFTNLTQDHLDFHGTIEEYFRAKKILFDGLSEQGWAVTNADDAYGLGIVEGTRARVLSYGTTTSAHVNVRSVQPGLAGSIFSVAYAGTTTEISTSLIGRFNVVNATAAFAGGIALGIEREKIVEGIRNVRAVRGRFEQVRSPEGWTAIIDYAHTPDALENCLKTIRDLLPAAGGRVITVFGCGGNRDRTKRPIMGKIASTLSDITIITSDNPRKEDPARIIDEVHAGVVAGAKVITEIDRRAAIQQALGLARAGDVVLVAGKGHEEYQVVGDQKFHLDDREEVESFIRRGP
jgi:UDP-N-acetylmuramoyl-L-alanyl-D-glutamate--2,6-diaminopimelate ligase